MIAIITVLTLAVPFLPQTEALCGGAAAAMVFRFLGDRHADVRQFAPLVDRRAGGIAETALVDAIRARGWNTTRLEGSIDTIRDQLNTGHPLILLIEDRPHRYHYVVAVGIDDANVFVHDPTWGPSRRMSIADFQRRWKAAGFWTLLVTGAPMSADTSPTTEPRHIDHGSTTCDRLLDDALDRIQAEGTSVADRALDAVSRQCPESSAPLRELAGIRFSQKRWREAATLSVRALDRDRHDAYAWDVLGSSRFVLDDRGGALQAWSHIAKPTLDSTEIAGLNRTRYALVSQFAGLTPNTLLTRSNFELAGRRLMELPDQLTTSVTYRPESDGFATVHVGIVERSRWPRSLFDWASIGVPAAINRELAIAMPGNTGQGEVWEGSWRFWNGRPRVAGSFSAPRAGRLGGIWRVDGSWEAQTYRIGPNGRDNADLRQEQAHGAVTVSNWVMASTRLEATAGIDVWDHTLKTIPVGGSLEQRLFRDRMALSAQGTRWWAPGERSGFQSASLRALLQSAVEPRHIAAIADLRVQFASASAPFALWPGAGDGRARPALLRAHPLLDDGVVTGPVFGRELQAATMEVQRWFDRPELPRLGLAIFADFAHASDRLESAIGRPFQIDAGVGVRLRLPGSRRTIRVDYGHGIRDRRTSTITAGIAVN